MGVTSNGSVFNRAFATTPGWLTVWSQGAANVNPAVYSTLAGYQAATGQDGASRAYDGTVVVDQSGALRDDVAALAGSVATPLPADIAALLGQPTGAEQLGTWGR